MWHVEQLALVSILNSFVLDYCLRQRVTANISMFFVYQLPIPRLTEKDPKFRPIVERAARLICTTPEFDDLVREVGLRGHADGVTDPDERARLRAELDGIIAHLYGLTEEEFRHVLRTFPLVAQPVKDAALAAYHAFAPKAGDPAIVALIAGGESPTLEFKESVFWDEGQGKLGEKACHKSVAAFLNTDGGDLLLGVHDSGSITGIEPDIARVRGKRQDADAWLQAVTQLLINAVGTARLNHVRLTLHRVDGKDVCRIHAEPSPEPAWVKEGSVDTLYVRAGNTTRALSGREAFEYARGHWS